MPHHLTLALIFALAAAPAAAGPLDTQDFVTRVETCIDFGADGWIGTCDTEDQTIVDTCPGGKVRAVPPPEGGPLPGWCSVISGAVNQFDGEQAALAVVEANGWRKTPDMIQCRMVYTLPPASRSTHYPMATRISAPTPTRLGSW